jgi:hypothetical protein
MDHWMWPVSLVGILSTAVVCGTDMFFLTVGRPALRLASSSAGTEVMGFLHTAEAMECWVDFQQGLSSDKRKYPIQQFKSFLDGYEALRRADEVGYSDSPECR